MSVWAQHSSLSCYCCYIHAFQGYSLEEPCQHHPESYKDANSLTLTLNSDVGTQPSAVKKTTF